MPASIPGPVWPVNDLKTIGRDELYQKLTRGDAFKLVMALNEWAYHAKRIPGSVHFNTADELFAALKKDDDIVVYCSNPQCLASLALYKRLVDHGYTNVRRYSGGLVDWEDAGLPLEGDWVTPKA